MELYIQYAGIMKLATSIYLPMKYCIAIGSTPKINMEKYHAVELAFISSQ